MQRRYERVLKPTGTVGAIDSSVAMRQELIRHAHTGYTGDTLAFGRRRIRSSADLSEKGGEPTCIGFVKAAPSAVVIVEADCRA